MQSSWAVDVDNRPQFADIRRQLGAMLEKSAENYGYLQLIADDEQQMRL
jgi:hypothetical protein